MEKRRGSPFAPLWGLDPDVAYLNHGSFGACPKAILERQSAWRERMEREPVDFLARELPALLAGARGALAEFVGADPDDLAFVPNSTAGVNAVVRSLDWAPGDELLTTDHAYAACVKTLRYAAKRSGAKVVVAQLPFPVGSEDELVEPLLAAVTPRTRLVLVDQVSSPTALVFPVARLVAELSRLGVDLLVDGSHALGMVAMGLDATGASYTVANAHKWLCAPKGSAVLHVRRDRQAWIHPISISHGYDPGHDTSNDPSYDPEAGGSNFGAEFEWTGTDDPSAFLSVPDCLSYLGALFPGGWPELMAANRALALRGREIVCAALDVAPPCPESMLGSMASIPLPEVAAGSPAAHLDREALMDWFRAKGVESWFYPWPCAGGKLVRLSAQLYNHESQYFELADLLREAIGV